MKSFIVYIVFCGVFVMIFTGPAHAYMDPGTGSMIIQGLIAAVAAAGVTARLYWNRISAFFASRKSDVVANDDKGDAPKDRDVGRD